MLVATGKIDRVDLAMLGKYLAGDDAVLALVLRFSAQQVVSGFHLSKMEATGA